MPSDDLVKRLREGRIPDSHDAMERTAAAAEDQVGPPRPRPRRWRTAGLGIGAAVVLMLTPPGQSLAENIGELVGIGEPASLPPRNFGQMLERGEPIVLATDRAPDGTAYELVVSRAVFPERAPGEPGDAGGEETCLTTDFPSLPDLELGEICVGGGEDDSWPATQRVIDGLSVDDADGRLGPEARFIFHGPVSPEIVTLELTYENQNGELVNAPATVGALGEELRAAIGTDDEVGYAIGFVPDDGLPSTWGRSEPGVLGTVVIAGYDADGNEVGRYDFGAEYNEQREDLAAAKERGLLSREDSIAFLALCSRAGQKVREGRVCVEAESDAEEDGTIRNEAAKLVPLIETNDGRLTLDVPGGSGYAMDLGR